MFCAAAQLRHVEAVHLPLRARAQQPPVLGRQPLGRHVDQRVHVARRLAVVTEDHAAARAERGDAVLDERRAGGSVLLVLLARVAPVLARDLARAQLHRAYY